MTARPRVRALTPLLVVSDLQRSIDFYCAKLGFTEPSSWGEPPCFALANRDGFGLMLGLADARSHGRANGPGGVWDLYLEVADLAAEMAALEACGVRLDKGPTDTSYGRREIELLDPDGHRICLAQDTRGGPLPDPERFEGLLDVGAAKLRLVLALASLRGKLVGRLDSLDQGARDLPLDELVRAGPALRFEMRAIGASFEGTFSDGDAVLSGRWTQRGRSWPLVFRR